ncbi:VOC family protein [uncultured Paraglaciecola sp.]|uniref:VOC family protein n=1 Tax=uncultured Paraglaciecola sp. TaxID=1765024 RepID=UPI00262AA04A|nr:VOC family protein [uncultured Paraglaciecola sp.]
MKQLIPYINFNGQCQAALDFYQSCFRDAEVAIQTFASASIDGIPPEIKDNVMHAEFKSQGVIFMATDGQGEDGVNLGNNIHLNLQMDSTEEQIELFDKLAVGGSIVMPLQQTFWNARFGMLTDKFGVQWMLNVLINPESSP